MGLFKPKEKQGIKCPACGSTKIGGVKGTQAVMAYPGFYSGIANDPEAKKQTVQCRDCKSIFRLDD
jgi:DNA-directed RNA polymerase subunit RPC12/RpoP